MRVNDLIDYLVITVADERKSGNWGYTLDEFSSIDVLAQIKNQHEEIVGYCRSYVTLGTRSSGVDEVLSWLLLIIDTPASRRTLIDIMTPGYAYPAGAIFRFRQDALEQLCYGLASVDPFTSRKCAHVLLRLGRDSVRESLIILSPKRNTIDKLAYGLLEDFLRRNIQEADLSP